MRLEEIVSPREIYDVFEVVVPRDRERTGAARRHKMVVHRAIVRKPAIFGGLRCSRGVTVARPWRSLWVATPAPKQGSQTASPIKHFPLHKSVRDPMVQTYDKVYHAR